MLKLRDDSPDAMAASVATATRRSEPTDEATPQVSWKD
jgi:hypothetical protein